MNRNSNTDQEANWAFFKIAVTVIVTRITRSKFRIKYEFTKLFVIYILVLIQSLRPCVLLVHLMPLSNKLIPHRRPIRNYYYSLKSNYKTLISISSWYDGISRNKKTPSWKKEFDGINILKSRKKQKESNYFIPMKVNEQLNFGWNEILDYFDLGMLFTKNPCEKTRPWICWSYEKDGCDWNQNYGCR